jgi:hypothetical protein
MEIKRFDSEPSRTGPAEYFTGTVRIDLLFQAPEPARASAGSVTFEPGARTGMAHASVGCRLALLRQVERAFNLAPQSCWLVPLRDVLSFVVFISSFFGQSATSWRGRRYRFVAGGALVPAGSLS